MKSVMLSIQPYYVFLIIARLMWWCIPHNKTVEVRKNFPQDKKWNRTVHIYCSKNRRSFNRIPAQYQPFMAKLLGKVVGEFVCDKIEQRSIPLISSPACWNAIATREVFDRLSHDSCLSKEELSLYAGSRILCFWNISDIKIYDKPKELGEFKGYCEKKKECYSDIIRHCKNTHFDWKCNSLTRPPQSWCYVEED